MTEAPTDLASGEDHRPRLHYTAADTWLNDPNGLVHAYGLYHLFYQNNPRGTQHANLSWGHAVSTDLIHWRDRPVAIPCDEDEQIYSGSAVDDEGNTSGFAEPGSAPLVAVYTSHYSDSSPYPRTQAQSLAYSLDGGETWTKYEGNPVLNRQSSDFRDPKVFRYNGAGTPFWVMVAVEAVDRKVVLYRSDDLKSWTYLSQFEASTPVGVLWECPDLFPLPIDGDEAHTRWVLIVNVMFGDVAGGSGAVFFVGDFDGTCFVAAGDAGPAPGGQPEWEWLDHGRDYYATVSFNDAPDGRRVTLGWMNNWSYALDVPTHGWRGAMTLPREVSLHRQGARLVLRQNVVPGLQPSGQAISFGPREIVPGVHPLPAECRDGPYLLEATFDAGSSSAFGLVLRHGVDDRTRVGYDTVREELSLDRTESGDVSFSPHFPVRDRSSVTLIDGRLRLQLYLDTCSVEVFAQDGLATITDLIFPSPSSVGLSVYSVEGTAQLISLELTPLRTAPVVRLGQHARDM